LMLSLFSSNKSGDRGDRQPKPKPKSDSFDLDSFLSNVAPTTKDFTVADPNPKQIKNPEEDRITHVPSKSALKVMGDVHHKRSEQIPKDLQKVSKKLTNTLKQIEADQHKAQNFHKVNQSKIKKAFEESQKGAFKPRPDAQHLRKPDESTMRPGHISHNDPSASFSRMPAPSYRKESSPPGSKNHAKKMPSKPREDDNERLELPDDFDLLVLQKNESYDPLDFGFSSNTIKRESSELYDPLNVNIRKSSDEQPVRPSKIEPTELIGKRSMGGDSERYAPDVTKKLKTEDQRKRFDAIFIKGAKKPHNPHPGHNNPNMKPRKYTHSPPAEERGGDDHNDYDDEARRELEQMFGHYRKKVQQRKPFEDDVDDMEAGFDEIDREERISRHIGQKEDQEQLRYIQMEEMNERKGKVQ